MLKRVGSALLLSTLSFNALAITSAATLPKGVRAGAFVFGMGEGIEDKFNSTGLLESLVAPINRSLTIDDLAEFEPRLQELQNVLNSIGPHNLGDRLLQVDLYQDLDVTERRYVTGLMWGISDSYMFGAIVPIVTRDYKASFRVESQNNLAQLKDYIGNPPGVQEALAELENAPLNTALFAENIFHKNGYKTPSNFSAQGLGDVELEGRWGYVKSYWVDLQFRHTLRLPTASHEVDLSNLIDRPLGQQHYSLKLASHHDVRIVPSILSWNTALSTTLHAPGTQRMAVKKDATQVLPDLNDPQQIEDVRKHTGADFGVDSGLLLELWKGGVSLSGSYIYNYHLSDRYSGKRGLLYQELGAASDWELHAMELGIEFSSIPLFLAKKLPVPARLAFLWNQPLRGRNTEFAPFGRVDVILLF